jgi:hypothetical protein
MSAFAPNPLVPVITSSFPATNARASVLECGGWCQSGRTAAYQMRARHPERSVGLRPGVSRSSRRRVKHSCFSHDPVHLSKNPPLLFPPSTLNAQPSTFYSNRLFRPLSSDSHRWFGRRPFPQSAIRNPQSEMDRPASSQKKLDPGQRGTMRDKPETSGSNWDSSGNFVRLAPPRFIRVGFSPCLAFRMFICRSSRLIASPDGPRLARRAVASKRRRVR